MAFSQHPKGLAVLFFTEMWERFSYYGMRAIFMLYMLKALLFDKAFASQIYGSYTGLVYLTPLIGGYIADKYWGNRKSILFGGLIMAFGQFLLFFSAYFYDVTNLAIPFFYSGLATLIIGNGLFKPNISSMVGSLYPQGDARVDSAMTIFYMGINLGAFFSPFICGYLGDTGNPSDFKWGFFAAGVGMLIGVLLFQIFKTKYIVDADGKPVGLPVVKTIQVSTNDSISKRNIFTILAIAAVVFSAFYYYFETDFFGSLTFSFCIAAPVFVITDKSLTSEERSRIWVIYIISAFVIFFWSAYEQAAASLTFFADEQTDRFLFGWEIPTSFFQSVNAMFIVILSIPVSMFFGYLSKRNLEPASPFKSAIGLFLLSVGYLVISFAVKGLDFNVKVSMMWLIGLYFLHTMGELFLSPIGLSMVVKLSPVRFTSLLMGIWFLSNSTANKFAGILGSYYPETLVPIEVVDEKLMHEALKPGLLALQDSQNNQQVSLEDIEKVKSRLFEISQKYYIPFEMLKFTDLSKGEKEQILSFLTENTVTKSKSFLGSKIENLYDFFMLFVWMSGVASIILFLLSRKLINLSKGRL